MEVHLIDGTYELFRYFHALPSAKGREGREVAAVRGVVQSVPGMVTYGATHIAIATDHAVNRWITRGHSRSRGPETIAERLDYVVICTPDKDLAQCVRGTRVVQLNRRTRQVRDEAGVVEKFGFEAMAAQLEGRGNLAGDATLR